jgi:hypothetical protein
MALALAMALRNHGIVASPRPAAGLKQISATVESRDSGPDVQIDVIWTVQDASGTRIGGNEQRVIGRPEDWAAGADRLISRIATQAAFRISRQLGRGDLASVPIAALPDVLGPAELPPPPSMDARGPAPDPQQPAPPGGPAPPNTAPPAAPASPPPVMAAATNTPKVRVPSVTGATAEASRAMTSAMRRALGESQMVLVDRTEPGVFQVQGSIQLAPPAEGKQRVVIRWVILRSDGTQVGDLEQANSVAAGSLDGNWEKLSPIVALAAVDAVVELINRAHAGGQAR